MSLWVKRGALGVRQFITMSGVNPNPTQVWQVEFDANNKLDFYNQTINTYRRTTQVFRDVGAWYHIVFSADTNNATAQNRFRCWVNGVEITAWDVNSTISSGYSFAYNGAYLHGIGAYTYSGNGLPLDGYLAEVNFIDGQALTPASFGEYDSVRNTQWKPKRYTGTYGTNGFYLNFSDNSNNTAATIGKDSSGNSNNWTPNGISITAGVTYDSMTDVPTLTGETAANFATMSPITGTTNLSNGNLYLTGAGAYRGGYGTIALPSTGKWYWEGLFVQANNNIGFGLAVINPQTPITPLTGTGAIGFNNAGQWWVESGTATTGNPSWTATTVVGMRYDASTGEFSYSSNGSSWTTIVTGTARFTDGRTWVPACWAFATNDQVTLNFGQRPFSYTPPTGFLALNTYNLPDGNVTSSDDFHKIYTYTGNGGGLQVGEVQKPASLFNLDRSLRFRSSASAFLSRTPASAGNRQKWTWSGWVKRSGLGAEQVLFHAYNGSNPVRTVISFTPSDQITFNIADGGYDICTTTQVFRDPAAWFHLCVSLDSTQATPADRLTIEVNGVAVAYSSSVSLNRNGDINTTNLHHISSYGSASFLNGYLADVYFVDGQKLTASNFGTYDGNFYWTPKAYTGTYGTNGFHLDFEDFSAATAAAIGKDTSGQGNNWTPNNINLTTPENTNVSWDSMVDVPTLTSTDVANFTTLNPLIASINGSTLSEANLKFTSPLAAVGGCLGTIGVSSGKWYWEFTHGGIVSGSNDLFIGIDSNPSPTAWGNTSATMYSYWSSNGNKANNASFTAYGASYTTNDVIGVALDMDAGTIVFYKNGTSQGTAFTGLTGIYFPAVSDGGGSQLAAFANFGQRPFRYTPPTGFKDLNSFNIAEVLGDVETPDFVWIKSRSASGDHALFNSVVGAGKYLRSSASGAEVTDVNSLIQFNKNGFLLGNAAIVNTSASTYVAAAWKAGTTTVTNTSGTITTQVRASQTAGISVLTYTGTGATGATIGHGLGAVPKMVIIKNQGTIGTQEWLVGHASIGWGSYLLLSSTQLRVVASNRWNNTDPTSSVITLGSIPNSNTEKYVAYCFSEINGFSKFGSYISNNATDGPFVYTGFRPRWLMVKRAIAGSGTGGWFMYDAARNSYNVMDNYMFAESTAGEATLAVFDFTSNGFKIRSNNVHVNTTAGDTYIYMAFAEHPFKYALAR
jgi:hypothetical protein